MSLESLFDMVDSRLTFNAASHRYWLDRKPIPGVTTIIKSKSAFFLEKWKVRVEREACAKMAFKLRQTPTEMGEFPLTEPEFIARFLEASGEMYEHEKQAKEAADIGSQIHALIEKHLKDQLGVPFTIMQEITKEAEAIFNDTWLPWSRSVDLEPLFIERRGFSEKHWFAGTKDLGALYKGRKTILDWKGRKESQIHSLYMEPVLQSIAYRTIMEELTGEPWHGLVVNVSREGGGVVTHEIEPKPGEHWTLEGMKAAFLACLCIYQNSKAFDKGKKWGNS